jgi:hypothetical protein
MPAGAAARPGCEKHGVTLIANEQVRVYRVGGLLDHTVYACLLRSEKRRRLGQHEGTFGGVEDVIASGRFVAYDILECSRETCRGHVRVMNVRSGQVRRSFVIPENERPHRLTDIVLKRNGAAAWIRSYPPGEWEVRKLDADGEVVLDRGSEVQPGSLALSRSSALYWSSGTQIRSATLR